MLSHSLKEALAESADQREFLIPDKSIDEPDIVAALMAATTALLVAMGIATALGLRPELGIMCAALACIGYVGILFGCHARKKVVESGDSRAADRLERSQ